MCKTSAKKNLYWEIKDKVIEEQFDGTKNIKRTAKVKVYGTDSNKEVRARLIEILYERVRYHKDKFIIPIIHQEMCGMQVKKNGKVEHSDNTHDDNVFSYLMALHVWYEGHDLTEKYGIKKNTIKTDEDVELLNGDIETSIEKKVKLDLHELEFDNDENFDIVEAYQFIEEASNFKTDSQFREETILNEMRRRDELLAYNEQARNAYCKKNNLDPNSFTVNSLGIDNSMITLPDNVFGGVDTDEDFFGDENTNNGFQLNNTGTGHLAGNLSSFWNQL